MHGSKPLVLQNSDAIHQPMAVAQAYKGAAGMRIGHRKVPVALSYGTPRLKALLIHPMSRLASTLFCLLLAFALPAVADVSREDAAAIAQQQAGGRVLSVDRSDQGGRLIWRVKVVTAQGVVRVIYVDAGNGRAS